MEITEKVAYLKGLAEGLDLDTAKSKEGKLISVMIGILEEIGMSIEDLEENTVALGEEIDAISDDLSDVEKAVFDEDDDDDDCCCGDEDDDFFEVDCPNCGDTLMIDESVLEEGVIQCPGCKQKFALDLSDDCCCGDGDEDGCGCGCEERAPRVGVRSFLRNYAGPRPLAPAFCRKQHRSLSCAALDTIV